MHKIEFESHVLVGDVVFVVARKPFNEGEKKIYKPCPVCENKRKVWTNTEPTMQVDCPRCTGSRRNAVRQWGKFIIFNQFQRK